MHPLRRRRLLGVLWLLTFSVLIVGLLSYALRENINLFYPPEDFASGRVPVGRLVRLGGLVETGSLKRDDTGLQISFVVTDGQARVPVRYNGLTPNLFSEGRGVVATGRLNLHGDFIAEELLAKHDENYSPPLP